MRLRRLGIVASLVLSPLGAALVFQRLDNRFRELALVSFPLHGNENTDFASPDVRFPSPQGPCSDGFNSSMHCLKTDRQSVQGGCRLARWHTRLPHRRATLGPTTSFVQ